MGLSPLIPPLAASPVSVRSIVADVSAGHLFPRAYTFDYLYSQLYAQRLGDRDRTGSSALAGTLSDRDCLVAEHAAERLLDAPTTLSEPYARHLGDGLRELRFSLGHDGNAVRVTYWPAPRRRIVLLTVFRKTRMREDAEVDRAKQAIKLCEAEDHAAHDEFSGDVTKGEGP
jgi:hypothetical protein